MRVRRMTAAALATVAIAGTGVAVGTPQAAAVPIVDPLYNGFVSTVGGCQTPIEQLIQLCTNAQMLSPETPIILTFNPLGTNIVVLGYGLLGNGAMRPELITRLMAARDLANQNPAAPIIVTGGNPHGGRTEAQAMRSWLIGAGINAGRITAENRARSTVENANNSWAIARGRGATGLVVVTSGNHLRRALINFREAVGGAVPVEGVVANDPSGSAYGS